MVTKKRNMSDMAYSRRKPSAHNSAMIDVRGHTVRVGDEVVLLQSSVRHARYIIDEINGQIAYLRLPTNKRALPFPVLSEQIFKVKRRQDEAPNPLTLEPGK